MEVNVLDHGADPTGSTYSTIAIQESIDMLGPSNCVLTIPPGRYLVNAMMTILNRDNVVINARGATLDLRNEAPGDPGKFAVLNIHTCTRFLLDGLTVKMDGQQAYSGVNVANSTNGLVRGVTVTGAPNGYTRGWVGITVFDPVPRTSKNISITECTVTGVRFGISVNGLAIRITNCHVEMPKLSIDEGYYDGIMVLKQADQIIVSNCTVMNCGAAGIWTEPCTNLIVTGNVVSGTLGRGIEVAAKGAVITGNVVRDCLGNINLLECRDIIVTGNRVENSVPSYPATCLAINTGSSYVHAVGNYLRQANTTYAAIWVWPGATGITLGPNGVVAVTKYSTLPAGVKIIP